MAQTLLLRLPAPGQDETEWLAMDDAGNSEPTRQRGSLTLAAAVSRNGKVIALAPATQMLLAEPELPPGGGVKLAKAVPFALEEHLTEDVDQLTFAIGRRRLNGTTPVAVVSRALVERWLSQLREAGLEPLAIYPDISLMPENPSQTVIWLEDDRVAVRRPGSLPLAVELSPVGEALVVAGVIADPLDTSDTPKVPENAVLYTSRDDWARHQRDFENLAEKFEALKVQLLADGPLPWLARQVEGTEAVNLLQGEFTPTTNFATRWHRWRTPAFLAAGLLVAHVGAQALQIRQSKHQEAALDGQIASVFTSAMPSEVIQNPRRQMQARLDRLHRSGAGPEHFLRALKALGDAMGQVPKTEVNSLSYRDRALDLKMTVASMGALSQLTQIIGKEGVNAQIQSSTPVANGIDAHIELRDASAAKAQR
ncbi:MAG TPA: type II secretion system protein GspL [Steroidobacteraceae bacterium]|jgi:general secretion pathway protein L|nr:type II secretion system protein GspL [Steroidobacteraceae bacterium]